MPPTAPGMGLVVLFVAYHSALSAYQFFIAFYPLKAVRV